MYAHRYLLIALLFLAGHELLAPVPVQAGKPYQEEEREPRRIRFLRPAESTPVLQLEYARSLREQDRLRKAARQYRALVSYWPSAPEAALAQKEYADTLYQRGKLTQAFNQYQHLMETYAGQFPYDEVLKRQMEIAETMRTERKGSFLFFPGFMAPERAIPMYEQIVKNGPRAPGADEAQFLIGRTYEESGDDDEAVFAYERLLARYPNSVWAEEAQFRKAHTLARISRGIPNDLQTAETALISYGMFIKDHPDSSFAQEARDGMQEIQQRRATIAYNKADFYDRIAKKPEAAIMAYESLLMRFPDSKWTETAQKRLKVLRTKTGDNPT